MIEQILIIVIAMDIMIFTTLIGVVCGQRSVWKQLRKKGHVTIDGWCYTAVKLKEGQYKQWDQK